MYLYNKVKGSPSVCVYALKDLANRSTNIKNEI